MVTRRTPAEWATILEAFRKSGQTQVAFCRENGISEKTLGAHIRAGTGSKPIIKRSNEEWIALIVEQRDSGMSRNAWCKKHKISLDSMTSAEKRLGKKVKPPLVPEWVEVTPEDRATENHARKEETNRGVRILGGGLEIKIDAGYPVEDLAALIGRLVKQC